MPAETPVELLFAHRLLNDAGSSKARAIADLFTNALTDLEQLMPLGGREGAIVRTKLEEACFFAKKCMALQTVNQLASSPDGETIETKAIAAFGRYNAQGPNPWKTWDGKAVPRWDELNDQVRAKWRAAVSG